MEGRANCWERRPGRGGSGGAVVVGPVGGEGGGGDIGPAPWTGWTYCGLKSALTRTTTRGDHRATSATPTWRPRRRRYKRQNR